MFNFTIAFMRIRNSIIQTEVTKKKTPRDEKTKAI